ncbi:MAG: hypothetical protein ABII71_01955 [Candidatus Micrarchaeota archaeon]
MFDKKKKGQAAMEYLMTYGWAILVIVIVLVILVGFLPQFLRAPESCLFQESGFSCQDRKPVIVADASDNVHVTFQLNNYQGQQITVSHVLCTTAPAGDIRLDDEYAIDSANLPADADGTIGSGGSLLIGSPNRLPCIDAEGNQVELTPNSNFNGFLVVWYNFHDEVPDAPARKATAKLTGNVLEETS